MFYGISHIDVPVRDLRRAERMFCNAFGFQVSKRGEGWLDVDTGSCLARLIEVVKTERPASLRIQSPTIEQATDQLGAAGLKVLYPPMRTPDLQLMSVLQDDDGNTFTLWRELSEDEYGFDPEIPKKMVWEGDAEALLRSLLRAVPAFFRALARRKVTKIAEFLAREERHMLVDKEVVVRAYILSNAKITRDRVRKPLIDHGYDPEDYPVEFAD